MTIKIESTKCKDDKCDVRGKHYHANYLSESNGVVVNIGSPETFFDVGECRKYCRNISGIVEWEDKTKK